MTIMYPRLRNRLAVVSLVALLAGCAMSTSRVLVSIDAAKVGISGTHGDLGDVWPTQPIPEASG